MTDDHTNKAEPDRTRISMSEKSDVAYWTKKLDISKIALAEAIEKFGNSSAVIKRELRK